MRRRIVEITAELRGSKISRMREGAKALREVLEDGEACVEVDVLCSDRHKQPMWAVVVKNFLQYADHEIDHALSRNAKNVHRDVVTLMPLLLRRADESFRQLHTIMGKLVEHFLLVLDRLRDTTPLPQRLGERRPKRNSHPDLEESYATCCASLLAVPAYANSLDADAFENIMATVADGVEASQEQDDLTRVSLYARISEALLTHYTCDVHGGLVGVVKFFAGWCAAVDVRGLRGQEPVVLMFRGLNAVIARARGDVAGVLEAEGRGTFVFCLRHFRGATRAQREVFMEHLRLQFASAFFEAHAQLRQLEDAADESIWHELGNVSRLVLSDLVLNAVSPVMVQRRGVDVFKFVEPGFPREVLRLVADLVYYDAIRSGAKAARSPASSAETSQKRPRHEDPLWRRMLAQLRDAFSPQNLKNGRPALTQASSQITGGTVQVQSSAYAWSLLLIGTLQLRGEALVHEGADEADLVAVLEAVAELLLQDPKDVLLGLLVVLAQNILRVLQTLPWPRPPPLARRMGDATKILLRALFQRGSQLRGALRDADSGSIGDAALRLLATVLGGGALTPGAARLLQQDAWDLQIWTQLPSRTAAPAAALVVLRILDAVDLVDREDAVLATQGERPTTRKQRLVLYAQKMLPVFLGLDIVAGDPALASQAARSGSVRPHGRNDKTTVFEGAIAMGKVLVGALLRLLGGPSQVELLSPALLASVEAFDLVRVPARNDADAVTTLGSAVDEAVMEPQEDSPAAVPDAASSAVWHGLEDMTRPWLATTPTACAPWRYLACLATTVDAYATLATTEELRGDDVLDNLAWTTLKVAAEGCREHLPSLRQSVEAREETKEDTEMAARSLEVIAGAMVRLAGAATRPRHEVQALLDLWFQLAEDWLRDLSEDEEPAGPGAMELEETPEFEEPRVRGRRLPSSQSDDFEDESKQSGSKPADAVEAQTSGASLRLLEAVCKLALACDARATGFLPAFHIREDNYEMETRAVASVLQFLAVAPRLPPDAFEPVLDLMEQALSFRPCVLGVLGPSFDALGAALNSWPRNNAIADGLLPRINGLLFPSDGEGFLGDALARRRSLRAAQLRAAAVAYRAFRGDKLSRRLLALVRARFLDPATVVREAASDAVRVMVGFADPAKLFAIYGTFSTDLPPLAPEADEASEGDFTAFAERNGLPTDLVVLQRGAYEASALHTHVSMALADARLLDRVASTLCAMHRRAVLRPRTIAALGRLARTYGYATPGDLIGDVFEAVLSRWLQNGHDLGLFPYDLMGFPDNAAFCRSLASRILPVVLVASPDATYRFRSLQALAEGLSLGSSDAGISRLLDRFAVEVGAMELALEAEGHGDRATALRSLVERLGSLDRLHRILGRNLHSVALRLIDVFASAPLHVGGKLTLLSWVAGGDALLEIFGQLRRAPYVASLGAEGTEDLVAQLNPAAMLLQLLRGMQGTKQPHRRERLVEGLGALVGEGRGLFLQQPHTLMALSQAVQWMSRRDVMQSSPRLFRRSAELLAASLDLASDARDWVHLVRDFFVTSAGSLEALDGRGHDIAEPASALRGFLDALAGSESVPALRLHGAVSELADACVRSRNVTNALAAHLPLAADLKTAVDAEATETLSAYLDDFNRVVDGDRRDGVIAALLAGVERRLPRLLAPLRRNGARGGTAGMGTAESTGVVGPAAPETPLRRLVLSLCRVAARRRGTARTTAVACLGRLGVATAAGTLDGLAEHGSAKPSVEVGTVRPGAQSFTIVSKAEALAELAQLLIAADAATARVARLALCRIMALREGAEVAAVLQDRSTRLLLEAFAAQQTLLECSVTGDVPAHPEDMDPEDLDYRQLCATAGDVASPRWRRLAGSDFAGWIQEATISLVREYHADARIHDAFWLCCVPACAVSPRLCRTLFPAVLYEALAADAFSGPLTKKIRGFLANHVFAEAHPSPALPDVMRACIGALHYAVDKQIYLFKIRGRKAAPDAVDASQNPSQGDSETVSEAPLEGDIWPFHAWMREDLLKVASAAAGLGAHCSALLFVEIWCDLNVGNPGIVFSSADDHRGMGPKQAWQVEALLHRIYSGLGDADAARLFEVRLQAQAASSLPAQFLYGQSDTQGLVPDATDVAEVTRRGAAALQALATFDGTLVGPSATTAASAAPCSAAALRSGAATTLKRLGLWYLVDHFVADEGDAFGGGVAELRAEAAWRSGKEHLAVLESSDAGGSGNGLVGFHSHLHGALRALREGTASSLRSHVAHGVQVCGNGLAAALLEERMPRLVHVLAACQSLVEVQEAWEELQRGTAAANDAGGLPLETRWRRRGPPAGETAAGVAFEHLDLVHDVEKLLLRHIAPPAARLAHGIACGRAARKAGALHRAQAALEAVRDVVPAPQGKRAAWAAAPPMESLLYFAWHREQAQLDWRAGATDRAVQQLRCVQDMLAEGSAPERLLQRSITSVMIGSWLAEQRTDSAFQVLLLYLVPGRDAALGLGAAGSGSTALEPELRRAIGLHRDPYEASSFAVADYVAAQYDHVLARTQAAEWKDRQRIAADRQTELARCKQLLERTSQRSAEWGAYVRHTSWLEREVAIDEAESTRVAAALDAYLAELMSAYHAALTRSSSRDLRAVSRVVSLWFAEPAKVATDVGRMADEVASFKFVPLVYQIFSRLGPEEDAFQRILGNLVLRMCREHPHHCLLQLVALRNGGQAASMKVGENQFKKHVDRSKVARANELLLAVEQAPGLGGLVRLTNKVAAGYVALAEVKGTDKKKGKRILFRSIAAAGSISLPGLNRELKAAAETEAPAIFTHSPPLRRDANYDNAGVLRLREFDNSFVVSDTGLSAPRILLCADRDGERHRQLVKGNDDTRQDAVMQQAFATVNAVLAADPAARARKLRIITYRIVPLSPAAGVLEWVENTEPFGSFLIDKKSNPMRGAHSRYFPDDWTYAKCREHIKSAKAQAGATPDALVHAFLEVCANFRPAFRFFFLEKFAPSPELLVARRRAYTHSVACSSIVGHILGIGDRHTTNILVHQRTAEVVHIDFGITFEQGRNLAQPETVPFRLTRDIVDGMGITHTVGAFSRACADTLRVLKKSQPLLVTILEVLLHDPLFKWMLSPVQARRRQGGPVEDPDSRSVGAASSQTSQGDAARRAIMKVKQKLAGYEDANGDALSVEGQVKTLIGEAQNPENLARIFIGWAPML